VASWPLPVMAASSSVLAVVVVMAVAVGRDGGVGGHRGGGGRVGCWADRKRSALVTVVDRTYLQIPPIKHPRVPANRG
jgi:hypothetical protein